MNPATFSAPVSGGRTSGRFSAECSSIAPEGRPLRLRNWDRRGGLAMRYSAKGGSEERDGQDDEDGDEEEGDDETVGRHGVIVPGRGWGIGGALRQPLHHGLRYRGRVRRRGFEVVQQPTLIKFLDDVSELAQVGVLAEEAEIASL